MNKIYNSIVFQRGYVTLILVTPKQQHETKNWWFQLHWKQEQSKKKLEVAPAVKLFKPLCVPHFPHGTASTKIRETANLTSADKFNCRIYKISKIRCKKVIVIHHGRQNNNVVYYRLSHDAVP